MSEIETKPVFRGPNASEIHTVIKLCALLFTQSCNQEILKAIYYPVKPDSALGYLVFNGGDFFNGYAAAFVTKALLDANGRKISEKWKYAISTAAGTAAITVAETLKLPIPIMGTTDVYDIPAGLLGIACYLGVSLWGNRTRQNSFTLVQSKSAQPPLI